MRHPLLAPVLGFALSASAAEDPLHDLRPHPRLLLTSQRVSELRVQRQQDPRLASLLLALAHRAEAALAMPLPTRRLDGDKRHRLLETSRETLARVLTLGLAHRLDPTPAWRARMIAEVDTVCAFSDWHPQHFLDTAEMATAVAIAYDWLHDELDEPTRARWRERLISLALVPSEADGQWWVRGTNNWNQVCHGGMVLGALAIADHERALATRIVQRALMHTATGLAPYGPNGVYPEGPTYWSYGTAYTVLTIAALESALGHDGGLTGSAGFADSFVSVAQCHGPLGLTFNYADSGLHIGRSALHLWAAQRWQRDDLAAWAWPAFASWLAGDVKQRPDRMGDRFLPLAAIWYTAPPSNAAALPPTYVARGGPVEIALLRTRSDDPLASFVGFKAGELQVNHGHLDVGSFVFDTDGVRWAHDLGMEKEIYDRTDSWGLTQDAKRWDFLRANNFSHNTLTIADQIQRVAGESPLIAASDSPDRTHAIADLSAAYAGQAARVQRGIALLAGRRQLLIQDEITAATGTVRWTWVTRAEPTIAADGRSVVLREGDEQLTLRLMVAPSNVRFSTASLTPPTASEHQNTGFYRLIIELPAGDTTLTVLATPGEVKPAPVERHALAQWAGAF